MLQGLVLRTYLLGGFPLVSILIFGSCDEFINCGKYLILAFRKKRRITGAAAIRL
jgi:hypothetical protein